MSLADWSPTTLPSYMYYGHWWRSVFVWKCWKFIIIKLFFSLLLEEPLSRCRLCVCGGVAFKGFAVRLDVFHYGLGRVFFPSDTVMHHQSLNVWCYMCAYGGNIKVVTAGELFVFSGSLASHSKSVRRHYHWYGHASHSLVLKAKNQYLYISLSRHNEDQT